MRFQERDGRILQAIQDYDGVLARRQIKQLFWPANSWRVLHRRLAYLHFHSYIDKPDLDDRRKKPIPESVVWLDWKGALYIAGQSGVRVERPKFFNENQLRILDTKLRKAGLRWMRQPRWSQLAHDLKVVDVRLAFEQAINNQNNLKIEEWINESAFRTDLDVVEFSVRQGSGGSRKKKRGVCPDGSFVLLDQIRRERGEPHRARFLLELDMATHDNTSFGLEKAATGVAYIKSNAYRNRFGSNSGRWLVVTSGKVRMKNLIKQTKKHAGGDAHLFFFTTQKIIEAENPLVAPIWFSTKKDEPVSLLS